MCADQAPHCYGSPPPSPARRPLSEAETGKYAKAFDDSGSRGRKALPVPGTDALSKGKSLDLLMWKPDLRVAQFVPRGGLAQENRTKGSTLRGARAA